MIHVQDIMSRPIVTCRPSDSLELPARLMWEQDCCVVVVVEGDDHGVGVVTDRDICIATWSLGAAPKGSGPLVGLLPSHGHAREQMAS